MQMLTFFGTMCLIVLTGIASSTDENLSEKSQCIEWIVYQMNIFPHIHNNSLNVESYVTINFTCTRAYIELYFGRYCDYPNITMLTKHASASWKLLFWSFPEDQFNSVDITLESLHNHEVEYITPGIYQILVKYNCTLNKVATVYSYVQQSEETKYLILPRFPAEWIFPYWKNPETKATFTIQINHSDNERAISNMRGVRVPKGNMSYSYFPVTPEMSTHLVAIAIVPLEAVFNSNLTHFNTLQFKSSLLYAVSLISNITHYVTNKWEAVPWSSVFYAAVPLNSSHYESIIIKNLVIFNEAAIVYDNKTDSLIRKKEVTCFVARSIIQEMFSDWLTTFKQSDSWFMEGFLSFYGVYIIDQAYNKPILNSMVVQTRREVLDFIEAISTYDFPVKENSSFISPRSLITGLWRKHAFSIFFMITDEHVLYNSIFEKAINLYYNTTSSDNYNGQSNFGTVWSKLMVEKPTQRTISLIRNLTTVITSWAYISYPLVQVNRYNTTRTLEIIIRDCFLSNIQGSCVTTWWIPVTYVKISQSNNKFRYQSFLQPDGENIILKNIEEHDFVIFLNTPGYRVNYDRKSWKNIARFLKNETPKMSNLSDVTLAQILDDAFYFLVQNTDYNRNPASNNTDNLDIFFDLASSIFQVNNSYIAWYPIFTTFEYLSTIFPYPESTPIKNKILNILNKFLENSSPTVENSITNQLYHEVLKWNCILDGLKCKLIVIVELRWHVQNSTKNKLLPSWQKWIYCQGLMSNITYESSRMWRFLLNMYLKQSKVEEMFEFLPCSKYSENILHSVYSLSTHSLPFYGPSVNIKQSDGVTFLFNIFAKHSKNIALLTSILDAIKYIQRDINIVAILTCIINNIYSDKGLSIIDEKFLQVLTDARLAFQPPFLINAIEKKVDDRRIFLNKLRFKLRYKLNDALTYRHLCS